MTKTNETTRDILKFLFARGVYAWRHNVLPIPVAGGGYRSGSKAGIPDIIGILPEMGGISAGTFFGAEIKTGKDRLRPEQIGFHTTAKKLGAVIMVVKDYQDFLTQWEATERRNYNGTI